MNSEITNPKIINYYLILGIDYDDESLTNDLIESTIKNKYLEWGRRKNTEPLAEKYIELIGDIKNIMSDPILRAEHADAARELLGNTITKELLRNSKNNNINKTQLERISNFIKTKFENTDNHRTLLPTLSEFKLFVENKAKKLGIEVTEEKPETGVDYNKIYMDEWKNERPEGKEFFDDVHTQLNSLGYSDLYSFLGKDSRSPLNTLIDEAKDKLTNKPKSKADQIITANLCHNAINVFKDEKNREIYNKYLIWSEKKKILDELVLFVEINKELIPEYKKEALTRLSHVIGFNRAQNLLTAFCIYNPKIAAIGIDNRPLTPIKIYNHSKSSNTSAENSDECGFTFHLKCPHCGSKLCIDISEERSENIHMSSENTDPKVINYYLILGIDYDDESLTNEYIYSTIDSKILEWNRDTSNPVKIRYIELEDDIKNVMSDPILRAEHADAARELLGNTITKELLRNSNNNKINKTQLERISNIIKTKFENTDNHRTLLPTLSEFKLFVENKAEKLGIEVTEEKNENSI